MNSDMSSDDARKRVELLEAAERAIRAIWDWDYLDWDALDPYVTGQLAKFFHANLASPDEQEQDRIRVLTELALDVHAFEDENKALVHAGYSWDDHGVAGSENVVWVFVRQDGVWRASGIGRENDLRKKENKVAEPATTDAALTRQDSRDS